jgi:hypothetical protein
MDAPKQEAWGDTALASRKTITPLKEGVPKIEAYLDVFGEQELRQQLLMYPSDCGDDGFVAIRFGVDGTVKEVLVPEGVAIVRHTDREVSKWLIERDGR